MYGLFKPGAPEDYGNMGAYHYADGTGFLVQELIQNCSLLCFTDFIMYDKLKLKKLIKKAAKWAYTHGGYTKVFCTMSTHTTQREAIYDVLLDSGFIEVGKAYINRRTTNRIHWLQADLNTLMNMEI